MLLKLRINSLRFSLGLTPSQLVKSLQLKHAQALHQSRCKNEGEI